MRRRFGATMPGPRRGERSPGDPLLQGRPSTRSSAVARVPPPPPGRGSARCLGWLSDASSSASRWNRASRSSHRRIRTTTVFWPRSTPSTPAWSNHPVRNDPLPYWTLRSEHSGAFLRLRRLLNGRSSFTLCFLTYSDSVYRDEVARFLAGRLNAKLRVAIDASERIGTEARSRG